MLASVDVPAVVLTFVIACCFLCAGAVVIRDWRNYGSALHERMLRPSVPWSGVHRDFRTFQLMVGVGLIGVGVLWLTVLSLVL